MLEADRLRFERARPLRAREYMRLVTAGVFTDEKLELLGGVLVKMSPQGRWHAEVVRFLAERLTLALHRRSWVRTHSGLELSDDSVPEPDIAVVPIGRRGDPVRWATLVVEVSESSLRIDRGVKAASYAAARIPEYWIVDLRNRRVEVYTDPDPRGRRYRRVRVLVDSDTLRPTKHRVAIRVDEVLPPPRRRSRH